MGRSPKNPQCTLDLGAQFIHARTEHQKDHRNLYEEMIQQRLIHPIVKYKTDINLVKYVAPNGSASIVKHFFQKSGIAPSFKHHIDHIKLPQITILKSQHKMEKKTFSKLPF